MTAILIALGILVGFMFFKILKNTAICHKLGKPLVFLLCVVTGVFLSMKLTVVFVVLCCLTVAFYTARNHFQKIKVK